MALVNSFRKMFRLITFRSTRDELLFVNYYDLVLGLIITWIVGIGRYWDDPIAPWAQKLGLGSVFYVFFLAALLYQLLRPFKIEHWKYLRVLVFVSLTSFPAIFYAIPVEKFYSLEISSEINKIFLEVVASWRVALLFFYLKRFAGQSFFPALVGTFLPITFIVTLLTVLNLERAVFNLMGGLRDVARTSHDSSYAILFIITFWAVNSFIPLLLSYFFIIWQRKKTRS